MTNPKAQKILEKICDVNNTGFFGEYQLNPEKLAEYLAEITPDV